MNNQNIQGMSDQEREIFLERIERERWKHALHLIIKDWRLYVMLLPTILFFFFWRYVPMSGLIMAFKNFDIKLGAWNSEFRGIHNIRELLFGPDASNFWRAFRNTFLLSFYGLLFGFPIPILIALFFSEIRNERYRSIVQIFSYLPRFVSTVVITTIISLLFRAPSTTSASGVLLTALKNLGIIAQNADILRQPQYFRPIYIISGVWETAGYGSIVYFAAIMSISPTSYEAARIDGANKIQQIRHVTLPGIASTLIIMLILRIGDLLSVGYEKVLLLYDLKTYETADVLSTYIYRIGLTTEGGATGAQRAASADLFNSLIAMFLVIGSNFIARKVSNTSLY